MRVYFENPLEIIFAGKVESEPAELAALITDARQDFLETIQFLGSAGSDVADRIPALQLAANQMKIVEDALKPVPPPCDVSRIPSPGVKIEATLAPKIQGEHPSAKILVDELLTRFPEIIGLVQEDDKTSPYLSMGYLVEWLDSKGEAGVDSTVTQRLVDFAQWCEMHP